MGWLSDESGLQKRKANYVPLTPLSHLRRAAKLFPNKEAVAYGPQSYTYADLHDRVSRLASALQMAGISPGDVVATLMPNIPPHVEAHFGVPAAGAVLNSINVRLDPGSVAYIFDHGGAKTALVDSQFMPLAIQAIGMMSGPTPVLIEVEDVVANRPTTGEHIGYAEFIAAGDPQFDWITPDDEWESIALNYTSGTTGRPKGVVYHHRGAYLASMGIAISWRMGSHPRYLTIVPMFHCNGWNHVWMIPLLGGTTICCRDVTSAAIYDAVADKKAGFFGGAPIVLNTLVNAPDNERRKFSHTVHALTAGAPPAPATLAAIEKLGFKVTQVYGLTETFGHVTECLWDDAEFETLGAKEQMAIKARQGVMFPMMEDVTVVDQEVQQIDMNGVMQGEIVMRGNAVMKGYLKNPEASEKAFAGGYFHSEDIAVQHPDGSIQIVDRAKDIIISGGENVSSVEVEGILMEHPAVLLCAVVAKPDEKWGEVPCAFVERKPGTDVDAKELIAFARARLAGFKTPKYVIFRELPKTSTGKIQKFELREDAKAL